MTKYAAGIDYFEYANEKAGTEVQFTTIDDRDSRLVYTGTWSDDSSDDFYNGTARYTNTANASVELTFTGTAIRWYGQKDTNFGAAYIYIDDEAVDEVSVNGSMASGQLLFEKTGLAAGQHTIRVVCASPVIDVDYFAYAN